MSRIVVVTLTYHHHKPVDLVKILSDSFSLINGQRYQILLLINLHGWAKRR
jgi:hypothetical protein